MSTELDLDIAALVGEMEAPPCEHPQHGKPRCSHDDGPATHYVVSHCVACGYRGTITPVCAAFVSRIKRGGLIKCPECSTGAHTDEMQTILGPVNK